MQSDFFFHFSKHMTEFSNAKKKNDLGFLNFDLEADLEYLFNWNVKQLFLYLTLEYETPTNVSFIICCLGSLHLNSFVSISLQKLNQVVIWDKIILKGESYRLSMRNAKPKYYFWDDGKNLL